MFIALEGVDGSGKSTVADAVIKTIKKRFPDDDVEYLHFSQLKTDPIDEYALEFEGYAPNSGLHFVCDRLHWGETIYGPLYRGESALSKAAFRWVEMYLAARGATTWHVTAALETVQERLADRGEDYLAPEDVEYVWKRFTAVTETALTAGGTAYTDKWNVWDIAEAIVNDAAYKDQAAASVFDPHYIGRSLPTAILVGDVQGNSDPGVTAAPFMPRGASCGGFLMEALPEQWWWQLGICNANEIDLELVRETRFTPEFVALGSNASKALDVLAIEHGTVPHPQKVRRFNHGEQSQYGTLIRQAATDQKDYLSWPK